jgi:hypothetical protein
MAVLAALAMPLLLAGSLRAADEAAPAGEPATTQAAATTEPTTATKPATEATTGSIKGVVTLPNPMSFYILAAGPTGQPAIKAQQHRTKADAKGEYEIKSLLPGKYTVLLMAANGPPASINLDIEVTAGKVTDLTLVRKMPGPAGNSNNN